MIERIRAARPQIVYAALGQPKGEIWLARNYQRIGAPVCMQVGASFDFVAGNVVRAPIWIQRAGMEWLFRLAQEPRRLAGRYGRNSLFLIRAILADLADALRSRLAAPAGTTWNRHATAKQTNE